MNVQQFQAQQKAEYYQQQADAQRHNAAFIQQSYLSHGPPATINNQVGNPYSQISQVARANLGSSGVNAAAMYQQQGTVSASDPALLEAKASHYRQRAQQGQNEVVQAIRVLRDEVAQLPIRMSAIEQQAQQRRASIVEKSVQSNRYTYPVSPVTGRPSALRAQVNKSVGLSPVEAYHEPEQLPISPHTGRPSKLRAMIERSVGM